MPKDSFIPQKERVWIEARRKYRLSHAHIQMARELGMNPAKFGKLANHRQESWKAPLPEYIEHLYLTRFGKRQPDTIRSIEEITKEKRDKKAAKRPSAPLANGQIAQAFSLLAITSFSCYAERFVND